MPVCIPFTQTSAIVNSYNDAGKSLNVSEVNGLIDFKYDNFTVDYATANTEIYRFYELTILVSTITLTYLESSRETLIRGVRS